MVLRAAGHCECCDGHDMGDKRTGLVVDHEHTTGVIRGLVCHNCNMKLASGDVSHIVRYLWEN